jgi:hypothetical protein
MPLFEMRPDELIAATKNSFEAAGLKERCVIQRLPQAKLTCQRDGLMVLQDAFGDERDSQPRIDLLCLDTNANLVVVELKWDDDGGHQELQALRHAAMASSMTFDQPTDISRR